jgi:hypothetical protein
MERRAPHSRISLADERSEEEVAAPGRRALRWRRASLARERSLLVWEALAEELAGWERSVWRCWTRERRSDSVGPDILGVGGVVGGDERFDTERDEGVVGVDGEL